MGVDVSQLGTLGARAAPGADCDGHSKDEQRGHQDAAHCHGERAPQDMGTEGVAWGCCLACGEVGASQAMGGGQRCGSVGGHGQHAQVIGGSWHQVLEEEVTAAAW